uniref:Peptidase A1 domain-containing protein n=1 Tax=Percolomonas cosmopolitus TaxID=63605 RepID=A0A7S1PH32_9EUKA|mmetsp:Transcript_3601/g.13767  ORF Transcript_3601/g.13767 Transcript_3601/m.13767 type:complete len:722 (+) Transcript_3601:458-2623(+)
MCVRFWKMRDVGCMAALRAEGFCHVQWKSDRDCVGEFGFDSCEVWKPLPLKNTTTLLLCKILSQFPQPKNSCTIFFHKNSHKMHSYKSYSQLFSSVLSFLILYCVCILFTNATKIPLTISPQAENARIWLNDAENEIVPFVGGVRVVAHLELLSGNDVMNFGAAEGTDSTIATVPYQMVLSFNDLRFFLFCCADYGSRRRSVRDDERLRAWRESGEWIVDGIDTIEGQQKAHVSGQHAREAHLRSLTRLKVPTSTLQDTPSLKKKTDSPNCISTSALCVKYDAQHLRCPISGNIFQYAKCSDRQIAKHIHAIEIFERQWTRKGMSMLSRSNDRGFVRANRVSQLSKLRAPQMMVRNATQQMEPFSFVDVEVAFTDSHYFNGTDGMLGLGFSFLNGSWNGFVNQTSGRMWALDVQRITNDGFLLAGDEEIETHIASTLGLSTEQVQWSDKMHTVNDLILSNFRREQQYELDLYFYSTVFNMRFCGAYLFSNYSSFWPLSINTHIEGIALPEPFYRMIMTWLDVQDGQSVNVNTWTDNSPLPAISFQLSPYEAGPSLVIPLGDLVDLQHNGTLHVYKHEDIYAYSGMNIKSEYPSIQVGTRFLERYLVIVDMERRRTGFLEKIPPHNADMQPGSGMCAKKVECHKLQTYYESTNSCLEPACFYYGIQLVNSQTHQCEIRIEVYILLSLLLVTMLCVECFVVQCHKSIARPLVRSSRRRVVIHS